MVNPINFPSYNINSTVDPSVWSSLGNLGNVAREAQNRDTLADLGKKLAAGQIDYKQAAGILGGMGDTSSMLKFLALSEARRKQDLEQGASGELGQYFSGAGKTPAKGPAAAVEPDETPAATTVAPAVVPGVAKPGVISQDPAALPPPAVPVPSSPTVVGTLEGQRLGIYDTPSRPAPPPPGPPLSLDPNAPLVPRPVPTIPVAPVGAAPVGAAPATRGSFAQSPSIPSMEQGPTMEHVPYLLKMLPRLPESQQAVVAAAIKQAWENAKPTTEIATLNALRDDPQLFEMAKKLAEAKSNKQNVNILPGEKKYDETMGATLGEIHGNYIKEALKVPANKANLDAAERAMAQPGFVSGTSQPLIQAAQRAGVALGFVDADKAAPGELFGKLQNKAIMDAGGSASGLGPQISNADANIIKNSTFNASNTPAGNRMVIGYLRLLEDRKVEYTREMNKYASEHGGRVDINVMSHMNDWAETHPLDFKKVPGFDPSKVPQVDKAGGGSYKNVPFTVSP